MSARDSQIHYSTYEKIIKQTNYFFHQVNMSVQNSCLFINCENMAGLDSITFYFKNITTIFEVTSYILKTFIFSHYLLRRKNKGNASLVS